MINLRTISIFVLAVAVLLVVAFRASVVNTWEPDERSSGAIDSRASSMPLEHRKAKNESHASAEQDARFGSRPPQSLRGELNALTAAAEAGDANAQFRLAMALQECIGLRSFTTEPAKEDPRFEESRRHLQRRRERCADLDADTQALQKQADDWEARALSAGSPAAKAYKLLSELDERPPSVKQASMKLRRLIPSREPYVFYGLSIIEATQAQELTPKAIALRLLACDGGSRPPELCGTESIEFWQACVSSEVADCSDGFTLSDYYYHYYPHLFDSARGYLSDFRDRLREDRYEEFESLLSPP